MNIKGAKGYQAKPKDWALMYFIDEDSSDLSSKKLLSSLIDEGASEGLNITAEAISSLSGTFEGVDTGSYEVLSLELSEQSTISESLPSGDKPPLDEVISLKTLRGSKEELLRDFLLKTMKRYPSKNYALILWGDTFAKDPGSLKRVLDYVYKQTGKKIALLQLNSQVDGLETLSALKGSLSYLISSPMPSYTLPLPKHSGLDFNLKVIRDLKEAKEQGETLTPEDLAKLIVFEAFAQFGASLYTPSMSAFKTSRLDSLREALEDLSSSMLEELRADPQKREKLRDILLNRVVAYPNSSHEVISVDLGHLASLLMRSDVFSETVKVRARRLLEELDELIVAEEHVPIDQDENILAPARGLSLSFPLKDSSVSGELSEILPETYQLMKTLNLGEAQSKLSELAGKVRSYLSEKMAKFNQKFFSLLFGYEKGKPLYSVYSSLRKMLRPPQVKKGIFSPRRIASFLKKLAILNLKLPSFLLSSLALISLSSVLAGAFSGIYKVYKSVEDLMFSIENRSDISQMGGEEVEKQIAFRLLTKFLSGISLVASQGAILGGSFSLAFPMLLTSSLSETARIGYDIYKGLKKAKKADNMSVMDKLKFMDTHKHLSAL